MKKVFLFIACIMASSTIFSQACQIALDDGVVLTPTACSPFNNTDGVGAGAYQRVSVVAGRHYIFEMVGSCPNAQSNGICIGSVTFPDPYDYTAPSTTLINVGSRRTSGTWVSCSSTFRFSLRQPTVVITEGANLSICSSSTSLNVTFTNDDNSAVSWSKVSGNGTINPINGTITDLLIGQSGVFRASVANGPCTASDDIVVSNDAPVGSLTASETTICDGVTTTFTTTVNFGNYDRLQFRWNGVGAWINWNVANPHTWSSANYGNTLHVRAQVSDGACTSFTNVVTVDVVAPAAGTVAESQIYICAGGSTEFTTNVTNGSFVRYQYQWDGIGGTWTNWSSSNPYTWNPGNPATNGRYLYVRAQLTDPLGCGTTYTAPTFVRLYFDPTAPTISRNTGSASACVGDVLTVNVLTAGQNGVSSNGAGCTDQYRFSSNGGVSYSAWSSSIPIITAVAGTYFIQARRFCSADGCSSLENQVGWTVEEPATGTVSASESFICAGGSVDFDATFTNGSFVEYQYQWDNTNGAAWTDWVASDPYTWTPGVPAFNGRSYYVRAKLNNAGCGETFTAPVLVRVYEDPSAPSIVKDPNWVGACEGVNLSAINLDTGFNGINADGSQCSPQYRYSTDNGSSWSAWLDTIPSFTAVAGTSLIQAQRVCDGDGCDGPVSEISWDILPVPSGTVTVSETDVCAGANLTFTTNLVSSSFDEYQYRWAGSGPTWTSWGTTNPFNSTVPTPPSNGATLLVRALLDNAYCSFVSNTASITVYDDPASPTVTQSPSSPEVCAGVTLTVTDPASLGGTGTCSFQYRYSVNSGASYTAWGSAVPSFAATGAGGTNSIQIRSVCTGAGCNVSSPATVSWLVRPDPTFSSQPTASQEVCVGDLVGLSTTVSSQAGTLAYQWETASAFGGPYSPIVGATSAAYSFTSNTVGTAYYRLEASITPTDIGCNTVYSNPAEVNTNGGAANATLVSGGGVSGAVEACVDNGWTYYADAATPDEYIFGISKNGNMFTATVDITDLPGTTTYTSTGGSVPPDPDPVRATHLAGRYWNVNVTSGSIVSPVDVRFFVDPAEIAQASLEADITLANTPITSSMKSALTFFKAPTNFDPSMMVGGDFTFTPTDTWTGLTPGVLNGVTYYDLSGLTSFSGGGVGFSVNDGGAALPVELLYFDAEVVDNYVRCSWATATEINNAGFELMRSTNGVDFETIAWIEGNGNSAAEQAYSYNDTEVNSGQYYYRLKQVDNNGDFELFPIVSVKLDGIGENAIGDLHPNPTDNKVNVAISVVKASAIQLAVFNYVGQEVMTKTVATELGTNNVALDVTTLPEGAYYVAFELDGKAYTKKFVVAR